MISDRTMTGGVDGGETDGGVATDARGLDSEVPTDDGAPPPDVVSGADSAVGEAGDASPDVSNNEAGTLNVCPVNAMYGSEYMNALDSDAYSLCSASAPCPSSACCYEGPLSICVPE